MKAKFSILVLSTLLIAGASSFAIERIPEGQGNTKVLAAESTTLTPYEALYLLSQDIHIEGTYTETRTYPAGMEALNTTTTTPFIRDYGHIEEEDGTLRKATRVYNGHVSQIYFQAEDGGAMYEVLRADNTVGTAHYQDMGLDALYADHFRNPFDYLVESDIHNDLSLEHDKATFILQALTGQERAVKSAKIITQGKTITGLDFELFPKVMGVPDTTGQFQNITSVASVEIVISSNVTPFDHLKPSTNSNPAISTALSTLGSPDANYTVTLSSNGLATESAIYVTPEGIYHKANAATKGATNGDRLYVGDGIITTMYTYQNGRFINEGIRNTTPVEEYLGTLLSISPALFEKDSETIYTLIDEAKAFGGAAIAPSTYGMGTDTGVGGYFEIEDGKLLSAVGMVQSTSVVTFKDVFSDYGTTKLPAWVDLNALPSTR